MLHALPTVFCVGPSRLVREVTQIAAPDVCIRWAADLAAFRRSAGGLRPSSLAACIVGVGGDGRATLEFARSQMPGTRRCVVADLASLKMIQPLIVTGIATDLLYRPLDADALTAALAGVTRTHAAVTAHHAAPAMVGLPA